MWILHQIRQKADSCCTQLFHAIYPHRNHHLLRVLKYQMIISWNWFSKPHKLQFLDCPHCFHTGEECAAHYSLSCIDQHVYIWTLLQFTRLHSNGCLVLCLSVFGGIGHTGVFLCIENKLKTTRKERNGWS